MTAIEVAFRLAMRHAMHPKFAEHDIKINPDAVRMGDLPAKEKSFLFDTVWKDFRTDHKYGKIFVEYDIEETKDALMKWILDVDTKCPGGLDILGLDYIQLLGHGSMNKMAVGNDWIRFMKKRAMTFKGRGLVSIILSQTNREGIKDAEAKDGRYSLNALAEYSEGERSSDKVMFIWATEEMRNSSRATTQLAKNRQGPTFINPMTVTVVPAYSYIGDHLLKEVSETDFFAMI